MPLFHLEKILNSCPRSIMLDALWPCLDPESCLPDSSPLTILQGTISSSADAPSLFPVCLCTCFSLHPASSHVAQASMRLSLTTQSTGARPDTLSPLLFIFCHLTPADMISFAYGCEGRKCVCLAYHQLSSTYCLRQGVYWNM